jgi:hypothetical protein
LQRLTHLDLRASRLSALPDSMASMHNLRKLDLRWTKLAFPPAWLQDLESKGCRILL